LPPWKEDRLVAATRYQPICLYKHL